MERFVQFLIQHSRAIYLVFIAFAFAGFLAMKSLPSDVYPQLTFPRIAVIASAGDVAPERVLLTITRVLEEAASQVFRVKWIRSKTIRGSAELSVDFQHGTDLVYALHQLQGRLSEVQSKLPLGVGLTVEPVTPSIFPVISYNVSSSAMTQADLYSVARYQIQPVLSRVQGVARVQIQGGDIPEVSVQVSSEKLRAYGLNIGQISDAIKRTSEVQVVGRVDYSHQQELVVASNEASSAQQLENVVVAYRGPGNPILLKDLATVTRGYADRTSIVSVKLKRGLVINIFKQPSSNVLEVSDGVREQLSTLRKSLPAGLNISPAYDESGLVRAAMGNVRDAILIGIGLIIIVLIAFLRSWKTTLIAATAIPLSALASFAALYVCGQSLNLMSLGGLAIAIGLVIDDAIVVVENIHRQLHKTASIQLAVKEAMSELIGPVTSSTATTVVVFLPLGILSGVTGQFFTSLTITLTAAVIFSLVLAVTLTPLLSIHLLGRQKEQIQESREKRQSIIYGGILKFVLSQPLVPVILIGAIIFGAYVLSSRIGTDFLPAVDEGSYVLDYLAPPGSSLSDVDNLAQRVEKIIAATPEVRTWTRRTGAELGLFATDTNKGDILVVLKPENERKRSVDEVMEDQRKKIATDVPQLETDFHQILQDQLNDLSGAPKPVEIRIFGEDQKTLLSLGEKVQKILETVNGAVDISMTGKEGAPQIDLSIDPAKSGRIGLAPADVATQVQDAMLGRVATQIRQADRLIDVRVRLQESERVNAASIGQLPITGSAGAVLPLSAVSSITRHTSEREILCENQQRFISVESELEHRDLGSAVDELKKKLADFRLPPGYTISIAGLYASQKASFQELVNVLILSVVLVYLLLVLQFRSLLQPLAIFVAVPLAMFGVEVALYLSHTPFNVSSFMGVILLIGLVVKNGIILLEYTNRLREEGVSTTDALVEAGSIRFRPIMMTTLCTLLGLIPLAVGAGAGAELQKPLAIAVIGGLTLSTLLTLIFVPFVFSLIVRKK